MQNLLQQEISLNQLFQIISNSKIVLILGTIAIYYFGGILFRNYLVKWYTKRRKTIPYKVQTHYDEAVEPVYNVTDDDFAVCMIARILFPISPYIFPDNSILCPNQCQIGKIP